MLGLIVVVAFMVGWRFLRVGEATPMVPAGTPLPALEPEGWLNLPAGESFDPAGRLVVVDCWETTCGPCLADLPRLARIVANYSPRGVKFVSVTQETAADLPAIRNVLARTPGFDWPVAYGGFHFLQKLGVPGFPTVILFGRDGTARWSGPGSYGLEAALDAALAEPAARRAPAS